MGHWDRPVRRDHRLRVLRVDHLAILVLRRQGLVQAMGPAIRSVLCRVYLGRLSHFLLVRLARRVPLVLQVLQDPQLPRWCPSQCHPDPMLQLGQAPKLPFHPSHALLLRGTC